MVLIHAQVVSHLVKHRGPDLVDQGLPVWGDVLEVPLEQENAVGEIPTRVLDGVSLIEPERVVLELPCSEKAPGRDVVDGNLHVLQVTLELHGQRRQDVLDQPLELRPIHAVGDEVVSRPQLGGPGEGAVGFRYAIQLGEHEAQGVVTLRGIGARAKRLLGGAPGVPESGMVEETRHSLKDLVTRKVFPVHDGFVSLRV